MKKKLIEGKDYYVYPRRKKIHLYDFENTLEIASKTEIKEVEPKPEIKELIPNAKRYYISATNEYINII